MEKCIATLIKIDRQFNRKDPRKAVIHLQICRQKNSTAPIVKQNEQQQQTVENKKAYEKDIDMAMLGTKVMSDSSRVGMTNTSSYFKLQERLKALQ